MGKFKGSKITNSTKQKRPRNKKVKTELVFDEKLRDEYLTGFSKRKQERKKIAQEKIIERLKEEKKQLKLKKREELDQKWKELDLATNLDNMVEAKTFDLPTHTVTVTDVSEVDFVGSSGHMLGMNKGLYQESESGSDNEESSKNLKNQKIRPPKKHGYHHKKKNLTHLMSKPNKAKKRHQTASALGGKKKKTKQRRNANNK